MDFARQTVQENRRPQIVLERLGNRFTFEIKAGLATEDVLPHLGLNTHLIDVILELEVLLEHLSHSGLLPLHLVEQLVLLFRKHILNHLLVNFDQASAVCGNFFSPDGLLLGLKHPLVELILIVLRRCGLEQGRL